MRYAETDLSSAPEAMCHEFFDELRIEGSLLPNGRDLPALFDFTRDGETLFPSSFFRR